MDHNSSDGGGDAECLLQSPPMSHSMVVREIKRVVQVLEELGSTPLIDTRQITLVDLSVSGSESEGDADRVPRRVLFQSPEQPTKRELSSFHDTEGWLISLDSSVPVAGMKADVAPASTDLGAALRGVTLEDAGVSTGLLGLPPSEEAKSNSSKQPSMVEAGDSLCNELQANFRPHPPSATPDLLLVQKSPAISEETAAVDSCAIEEAFAVANMETTFAIPAVPSAPSTAPAPKKATSHTGAAGATMTFACDTFSSMLTGQSNSATPCSLPDELPIVIHEEAAEVDSCAGEEDLAVANADTTFAVPALPAAQTMAAVPKKVTTDKVAVNTTVMLEQGTVARKPEGRSDSAVPGSSHAPIQESLAVREEGVAVDSCASEEDLAVAFAETTFAVPALPVAPSTAAVPRKAPSVKKAAAETTVTLGVPGAVPRRPTSGQPLPPRRSMLPPPSQRAGRLSIPSGPTGQRGRPSVAPAAADTTFGVNKTTAPERRLPAPKIALQPSQRQAAPVSKPVTTVPGPMATPSFRRSVAGTSSGAAAASRRNLQAPATGALASGTAKQGPATRLSIVPETAAAARTSLRPPARPCAVPATGALASGTAKQGPATRLSIVPEAAAAARTSLRPPARPAAAGLRKSVAGPQKVQTSAGQRTAATAQLAQSQAQPVPPPKSVPQPKPEAAMAPQLPRSRLPPPTTRVPGGGLRRPAVCTRAPSSRTPPLLQPIVESPLPSRLSSTPARSDAPLCGGPDLTPIRKH